MLFGIGPTGSGSCTNPKSLQPLYHAAIRNASSFSPRVHILIDCRAYANQRTDCELANTVGEILSYNEQKEEKLLIFIKKYGTN